MSSSDHRHIARDSLFLMATLRLDGVEGEHRVRVRNLSSGGMMAEGGPKVSRGQTLTIELRGHGEVPGAVAWVQDSRIGIAFSHEVDPRVARVTSVPTEHDDVMTRRPYYAIKLPDEKTLLRKV